MGVAFVSGLAISAALVVADHRRRVAHPAARPARLRRREASRSPAGAASSPPGSSPSPCVGLGLERSPSSPCRRSCSPPSCSPSASSLAPLKRDGAAPASRSPLRADLGVPVEPPHPAPPVAGVPSPAPCVLARARRPASSASAWASPTRATSPRTPPPARPTTSSPTGSAPASTARSSWSPELPDGRGRRRRAGRSATPSAADAGVAFVVAGDAQRRRAPRPRSCGGSSPRPPRRTRPRPASCNRLRHDVLPPVEAAAGVDVGDHRVHGRGVDFSDYLGLAAALLLRRRARAVVPAADDGVPSACSCRSRPSIMNLLSIGAAYGVRRRGVPVGLAERPDRASSRRPIEPFVPMMLFAIVFGLSMDYEVFLLSRVKEEWTPHRRQPPSVADGLAATAEVITAAAAIMVVVFGSFCSETDRVIKLFGLGLAVGRPPRRHRSSACCWCPPRWSCSATATGGCRAGSTGCCPPSTSRARPDEVGRLLRGAHARAGLTGGLGAARPRGVPGRA